MKKKILIISNPGAVGAENYCEGVKKDVENYKKYFTSPEGEIGIYPRSNAWSSQIKQLYDRNCLI